MATLITLISLLKYSFAQSYTLVFNDTFANLNNWNIATNGTAFNDRTVWNTYSASNVQALNNALKITAIQQGNKNYTSGRVNTIQDFGPGVFVNIQASIPKANGVWPLMYLAPKNFTNTYGEWAACGSIELLSTTCLNSNANATLFFGAPQPNFQQVNMNYPSGINWSQPQWFGVLWTDDFIEFVLNGEIVNGELGGQYIQIIGQSPSADWKTVNHGPPAPFNLPYQIYIDLRFGGDTVCATNQCCSSGSIANEISMEVYNVLVYNQTTAEVDIQSILTIYQTMENNLYNSSHNSGNLLNLRELKKLFQRNILKENNERHNIVVEMPKLQFIKKEKVSVECQTSDYDVRKQLINHVNVLTAPTSLRETPQSQQKIIAKVNNLPLPQIRCKSQTKFSRRRQLQILQSSKDCNKSCRNFSDKKQLDRYQLKDCKKFSASGLNPNVSRFFSKMCFLYTTC